jgi:hypothetical protein
MSTSSLSLPSTVVPDATETSEYITTEQTAYVGSSETPEGQEPSDIPKPSADAVPGVQIETDILFLAPEVSAEEEPPSPHKVSPGGPESRARALEKEYEYYDEVASSDDDLESADTLVFRPLFRYRKQNNRRRVDKHDKPPRNNDPYRRVPFKYCPPCRYYFY